MSIESGGCSESTWRIASHVSSCSTSKLLTPVQRTLPSCWSSPSVPHESSSAVPVSRSGQWNCIRSIRSTFSRRRLCSTSWRIDSGRRSFSITPSGRSYQLRPHLLKTNTSSRSATALPTTSSECPKPYTAAVSIQLTPRSSAWWIACTDSSSSTSPQPNGPGPPMAHAPTPTRVISGPSLPSFLILIGAPLPTTPSASPPRRRARSRRPAPGRPARRAAAPRARPRGSGP